MSIDILDELLARLPADRIVAVATPDYTVTPMGASFGSPAQQSAAINDFNGVLQAAAERRGIAFVPDIFAISQAAATDRSLVADDGLHPSGAQYGLWVEAIQPVVEALLGGLGLRRERARRLSWPGDGRNPVKATAGISRPSPPSLEVQRA